MEKQIDYTTLGTCITSNTFSDTFSGTLNATPNNNNIYDINIKQLSYGYVVNIGCQSFAIENSETLIKGLSNYLKSPSECENIWMKDKRLPL